MRKGSVYTFFIYAFLVIFFIAASFAVKIFFVLQKSKFDGKNHFTIAVAREGRIEEVIAFKPSSKSLSLLKIEESKMPLSSVGEALAIIPDGIIEAKKEEVVVGENVSGTLKDSLLHYGSIKTDLTVFDVVRLLLLSNSISSENKVVRSLKLPSQESEVDKITTSFFGDSRLVSDGVNIQIVNASGTPGVGKRLERVISNLGGNIVSVSTAHKQEAKSHIHYSGEETYTVKKLARMLGFSMAQKDKDSEENIVITIGEDSKNTKKF